MRGLQAPDPCLPSREVKSLNAFAGVAYTEKQRNSCSSNVPARTAIRRYVPRYVLWVAIFSLLVLNSIASSEVRDNHLEKATRLGIRLKLVTLKSSSLGYDL